jgi:hypothetical protein
VNNSSSHALPCLGYAPVFLTPGQVYEVTIDLWATSHVFLPGHRVRLEIASSNFPRFDRNLNTGEDQATGSRRQTAAQTILHDQRHPSHILLPVIPRQPNLLGTWRPASRTAQDQCSRSLPPQRDAESTEFSDPFPSSARSSGGDPAMRGRPEPGGRRFLLRRIGREKSGCDSSAMRPTGWWSASQTPNA